MQKPVQTKQQFALDQCFVYYVCSAWLKLFRFIRVQSKLGQTRMCRGGGVIVVSHETRSKNSIPAQHTTRTPWLHTLPHRTTPRDRNSLSLSAVRGDHTFHMSRMCLLIRRVWWYIPGVVIAIATAKICYTSNVRSVVIMMCVCVCVYGSLLVISLWALNV